MPPTDGPYDEISLSMRPFFIARVPRRTTSALMAVPRSHQGISISGVAVLLATVLVVGHASGAADKEHLLERTRLLQNENDAVRVGIEFAPASGGLDNASTAAEDELVEALQKDDQVTGRYTGTFKATQV